MRRIFVFMNTSLDGYVEAPGHDLSWAHNDNEAFTEESSREVDTILLGHTTYDMMAAFWPTPAAAQFAPEMAHFMNDRQKVVAARASFTPDWRKVTIISGDVVNEVRRLKEQPGKDIIILGSNTLCSSLLPAGLIDEVQIVVNPVVLGAGTPLFSGMPGRVSLQLNETRQFKSGTVLLVYRPATSNG